ncbi:Hint domain-containing protein [Shimia marina]|uniref:Hedgehog/Intein (Hint) domain-containing protein n=1 Tax=Shimia marina TaxID=321267 RepID=A0A0N7LRI2_9RHOB|nr:Hint domain-containing protein [Shimia marina]CUH50892.1 hypothetical protein SHM7688_00323 [Shimia marina]SFE56094.1 Hint domain-containing protein [Shimia marina]
MPPINLILNGTFDQGSTHWSGSDLETNHREGAYLGNGSRNRVAEIDGRRGQTTVMEQSFVVSRGTSTSLNFDAALRTASNGNAGREGFDVEILDSDNNVIAFLAVRPTQNGFVEFSLPVTFPEAGTYKLRMTERGPNDSLGAIVDNIELMVCFHGNTGLRTATGAKPARDIQVGDLVHTANGLRPVRWVGRRRLHSGDLRADPKLLPVKITAGALGGGLPQRDLWVSRQHRMLVNSPVCERMFGASEVLVAAVRLCGLPGIEIDTSMQELDYVHLLFDAHEVVYAEGAPSESLLWGAFTRAALSDAAVEEILKLFSELQRAESSPQPAHVIPDIKQQKRLVWRLAKNGRDVLESYSPVSETLRKAG